VSYEEKGTWVYLVTSAGAYAVYVAIILGRVAGTSSFGCCRRVLSPGGAYLTTAPSPAIFVQMPWTARSGSRRALIAFTGLRPASEKRSDLLVIRELAEASALVPVVGGCYPLARIADAYRHVDAGHKKGTVVVTMS